MKGRQRGRVGNQIGVHHHQITPSRCAGDGAIRGRQKQAACRNRTGEGWPSQTLAKPQEEATQSAGGQWIRVCDASRPRQSPRCERHSAREAPTRSWTARSKFLDSHWQSGGQCPYAGTMQAAILDPLAGLNGNERRESCAVHGSFTTCRLDPVRRLYPPILPAGRTNRKSPRPKPRRLKNRQGVSSSVGITSCAEALRVRQSRSRRAPMFPAQAPQPSHPAKYCRREYRSVPPTSSNRSPC